MIHPPTCAITRTQTPGRYQATLTPCESKPAAITTAKSNRAIKAIRKHKTSGLVRSVLPSSPRSKTNQSQDNQRERRRFGNEIADKNLLIDADGKHIVRRDPLVPLKRPGGITGQGAREVAQCRWVAVCKLVQNRRPQSGLAMIRTRADDRIREMNIAFRLNRRIEQAKNIFTQLHRVVRVGAIYVEVSVLKEMEIEQAPGQVANFYLLDDFGTSTAGCTAEKGVGCLDLEH